MSQQPPNPEHLPNADFVGYADVQMLDTGLWKVCGVWRDHDNRQIVLTPSPEGQEATIVGLPHYDEEERRSLWERINAWKREVGLSPTGPRRQVSHLGRPRRRTTERRGYRPVQSGREIADMLGEYRHERSLSEREANRGKTMTQAEVAALAAEAMRDAFDDVTGGDA